MLIVKQIFIIWLFIHNIFYYHNFDNAHQWKTIAHNHSEKITHAYALLSIILHGQFTVQHPRAPKTLWPSHCIIYSNQNKIKENTFIPSSEN
jgi:hypothetical protein